jgi:hypothetical protein
LRIEESLEVEKAVAEPLADDEVAAETQGHDSFEVFGCMEAFLLDKNVVNGVEEDSFGRIKEGVGGVSSLAIREGLVHKNVKTLLIGLKER